MRGRPSFMQFLSFDANPDNVGASQYSGPPFQMVSATRIPSAFEQQICALTMHRRVIARVATVF